MASTTIAGTTDPRIIEARRRAKERRRRVPATFYWMVLPAFLLFFVFNTVPVLQGLYYSFTDFAGYGVYEWVGLKNYGNLFSDDRILDSYLFTFKFALVATVAANIVALAIAMGLNSRIKGRTALRGTFFIPNVLGIFIIGYIFSYMLSTSLPFIGEKLGIEWLSTSVLADPGKAWIGVVVVQVWQAMAFAIIIYLAGLQTIDQQLYEAASLDGASAWRQFRSITFPLLAAFFTINMVLALKNFMMVFDLVVSLTNGGPGTSTESISLVIYRGGFQGGEFAYQMANAMVLFLIIVVMSIVQLRFLQRREVHA